MSEERATYEAEYPECLNPVCHSRSFKRVEYKIDYDAEYCPVILECEECLSPEDAEEFYRLAWQRTRDQLRKAEEALGAVKAIVQRYEQGDD